MSVLHHLCDVLFACAMRKKCACSKVCHVLITGSCIWTLYFQTPKNIPSLQSRGCFGQLRIKKLFLGVQIQ